MKLALLVVFVVLCNDFKLGSASDESQKENCPDKCYKFTNGGDPNCCNQKPIHDPCSTVKCGAANTECVLHHIPAMPGNCTDDFPLQPRCQSPCAMFKCASYCVPTLNDTTKCPSCYCNEKNPFENPCLKVDACGDEEECKLVEVVCKKEPCYPVKQCRPSCPAKQACPENCLSYVDPNGCKKCHCCNGCVNKICPDGKKCVLNQVQCFTCPCPPIAECN